MPTYRQEAIGLLPYIRHRWVLEAPATWAPFTVYFVGAANAPALELFVTDANATPRRVGDGLFARWLALPGNASKTYDDFAAAMFASLP